MKNFVREIRLILLGCMLVSFWCAATQAGGTVSGITIKNLSSTNPGDNIFAYDRASYKVEYDGHGDTVTRIVWRYRRDDVCDPANGFVNWVDSAGTSSVTVACDETVVGPQTVQVTIYFKAMVPNAVEYAVGPVTTAVNVLVPNGCVVSTQPVDPFTANTTINQFLNVTFLIQGDGRTLNYVGWVGEAISRTGYLATNQLKILDKVMSEATLLTCTEPGKILDRKGVQVSDGGDLSAYTDDTPPLDEFKQTLGIQLRDGCGDLYIYEIGTFHFQQNKVNNTQWTLVEIEDDEE